jgi:hypothetical protein
MHESQNVLNALGLASKEAMTMHRNLVATGVSQLQLALHNDVLGYMRHGALALAEAISGINSRLSTWATIQLYYCVFYSARAWLGSQKICIFYVGSSPCSIEAQPGACAAPLKGQTHRATLAAFERRNPNSFFLSQQIEQMSPLDWLGKKRELANYKNPGPFEPELLQNLLAIQKMGTRKAVLTYLADPQALYTFDADHALFAFPLRFFNETLKTVRGLGKIPLDGDFLQIISRLSKDSAGELTPLTRLIT